ncbi:MAG TPA: PAS domain S-box protein [Gemmataceae bacterium]|nr:PAS domain S-box protein [Gemmataceae bacterium]
MDGRPHEAPEAVRFAPERLAEILDIAEDGIVTVNSRQNIVLFNHGAVKLFGYEKSEMIGRPLDLLVPERFRETHGELVAAFGRAGSPTRLMAERRDVYGLRKDGSEFPAEISISKFEVDGELLFTAIVRDITERVRFEAGRRELDDLRAKARLAESQARLDAVIRSALDAIVLLDADFRVTLFNPAAEQVFGCPAADAVGSPVSRFLPAAFPAIPREVEGRRADGGAVPLEVSASRVEGGERAAYALILRDITERRRAVADLHAKTEEVRSMTQQLWQAARLAGVGELAASIAHELNNPLGTVSLRVEGVLSKTPHDDPRRKALEVVDQEVERMAGLVANLLQFSRAGRDQVSTVDVCEEVTKTAELTRHHLRRRGVELVTEFEPSVPIIFADRQQLRQVLLNLFTNAGDAMSGGGRLTTRVRPAVLPGERPAVAIDVADTGVGIPAEYLPRVFEPFFTTKDEGKGTGLGLAICRRIVGEHRGTLELDSRLGEGTVVRVTLPVRTEKNVAGLEQD